MSSEPNVFAKGDRVHWTRYGDSSSSDVWIVDSVRSEILHDRVLVYAHREVDGALGVFDEDKFFVSEAPPTPHGILWLDLETTGLDPQAAGILEIAYELTFFSLSPSYSDPFRPRQMYGDYLVDGAYAVDLSAGGCTPFIQDLHRASGLLEVFRRIYDAPYPPYPPRPPFFEDVNGHKSQVAKLPEIEEALLYASRDWPLDKDRKVVLGGNSVHFDLSFLRVHLPEFAKRLSHRVLDASGLHLACRSAGMPHLPKPVEEHRALADLRRSQALAAHCMRWMKQPGSDST